MATKRTSRAYPHNKQSFSATSVQSQNRDDSLLNAISNAEEHGLGKLLLDRMGQSRDKILYADANLNMAESSGTVRSKCMQVAAEMRRLGVVASDLVLVCSKCHGEQAVAFFASICLGAIVTVLDPDLSCEDLKELAVQIRPRLAFCDVRQGGMLENIRRNCSELSKCVVVIFGEHSDRLSFRSLLKATEAEFKPYSVSDTKSAVAFVMPSQATSNAGDTDLPSLICLSHSAILIQVSVFAESFLQGDSKIITFFPLSWIPQVIVLLYCAISEAILVIPGTFSERYFCRVVHQLKIDTVLLSTEYAMNVIRHYSFNDFDLSCIKHVVVGGSVTTALEMSTLRTAFPFARVYQVYGMTEMTCSVAGLFPNDYASAIERPGSVGKLLPQLKSKIVHLETREPLDSDMYGELLVKGPTLMLGYFKNPFRSAACIERGYFRTGDIAQFDMDGYLYVRGRASDHIMLHGQRVHPKDIEEMIAMHPQVREVMVLGDDKSSVACVIKKSNSNLTSSQLENYICDRLPVTKRPNKIIFMESFPRTNVGKVKRNALRQTVLGLTIVHSKSIVSFGSVS